MKANQAFVLFLGLTASCGAVPPSGESNEVEAIAEPLVHGTDVSLSEAQAVGMLWKDGGMCTATMITRDIGITAGHCFDGATSESFTPTSAIQFEYWHGPESTLYGPYGLTSRHQARVSVNGYKSFGTFNPLPFTHSDIALFHLQYPIDPSVRPYGLASSMPPDGVDVTDYGFGCNNRDDESGSQVKRKVVHRQGSDTDMLCAGDSGGPMIYGNTIFAVNSGTTGFGPFGVAETFGLIPENYDALASQVQRWNSMFGSHPWPPPPPNASCGKGATPSTRNGTCGTANDAVFYCYSNHWYFKDDCASRGLVCRTLPTGISDVCAVPAPSEVRPNAPCGAGDMNGPNNGTCGEDRRAVFFCYNHVWYPKEDCVSRGKTCVTKPVGVADVCG